MSVYAAAVYISYLSVCPSVCLSAAAAAVATCPSAEWLNRIDEFVYSKIEYNYRLSITRQTKIYAAIKLLLSVKFTIFRLNNTFIC